MTSTRIASLAALALFAACAGGDEDPAADSTASLGTTTTDPSETGNDMVCVPGAQSDCSCPGGGDGVQVCLPDGSGLDDCECTGVSDSADASSGGSESTGDPDPCGDMMCDAEMMEDCNSCPADCGECVPCTSAPSCEGAQVPPVIDMHAKALDDIQMGYVPPEQALANIVAHVQQAGPGMRVVVAALAEPEVGEHAMVTNLRAAFARSPGLTDALARQLAAAGLDDIAAWRAQYPEPRGAAATDALAPAPDVAKGEMPQPCENPRLRVRVARIDVPEEDDDFLNDQIYCLIASEGTAASELRLTPITPALDEGDSHEFALAEGVVWGQQDLAAPMGNLALTYNCIESESPDTYNALFDAIGDAAEQAGGVAGDSGWIFDSVGVIANLLPSVLSLDGDDKLFNASQIIPEDQHLALTQGAYWMVQRSGTNINSDWEWHLRMEIWGCHDNGQ